MLILVPALLAVISGIALAILGLRPRFRYLWLVSAVLGLILWLASFGAWTFFPFDSGAPAWPISTALEPSLAMRWDAVSAALTLAVATVVLAAILTGVSRAGEEDRKNWGFGFLLSSIAMLGAVAGNLFTLVLVMGALDLLVLAVQLSVQAEQDKIDLAIKGMVYRGSGILFIYLAAIMASAGELVEPSLGLSLMTLILILGFYMRMGLVPVDRDAHPGMGRGYRTISSLAPVVIAVVFALRVAPDSVPVGTLAWFFAGLVLASVSFAWRWFRAAEEWSGRAHFLAGAAALIIAGVLVGEWEAGLIWSLAIVLSGSVLFLFNIRRSWFILLPLVGFWGLTGLPLSPSWSAMQIYSALAIPTTIGLLLAQGVLLAGFLVHALRLDEPDRGLERWERLIYPLGLILIPIINLVVVWLPWQGLEMIGGLPWWPGFVAAAAGLGLWWLGQRGFIPEVNQPRFISSLPGILMAVLREVISWLRRVINFISVLLEGEGGVLWALLFLALLITLMSQIGFILAGNGS